MLIKPKYTPADPTSVCRTCTCYDPNLHVCCANNVIVSDDVANTKCCGDWGPKHICITCEYFDPDTNQCWFEEHDMSEEESLTRTCESWEPRKEKLNVFSARETIGMDPVNPVGAIPEAYGPVITECRTGDDRCSNCEYCNPDTNYCTVRSRVMSSPGTTVCMQWAARVPLQSDGSLKVQASEAIGASVVNPDGLTFGGTSLQELAAKQKKQEEQLPPGACCFNCEHRDKMSLDCKLKKSDAVLTVMRSQHESCGSWEPEQDHGVTLRVVDPEEDKKQKEVQVQERLIAKEKGYRRGYMVAELHMMCDAASQLLPDRKPQWESLRNILEDALRALWARNDQDKKEPKA